jgi:hypothetical protein
MAVPVIRQSFTSPHIRLGEPWKVYLNASDPDGDMQTIVCTLEQPGVGVYPASFTKIPVGAQKNLSGYVYLNTSGAQGLNFIKLVLTVQIQDKAGNYSTPVSFPITFDPRSRQEGPPPGVFQENDLGPIMITLTSEAGGCG